MVSLHFQSDFSIIVCLNFICVAYQVASQEHKNDNILYPPFPHIPVLISPNVKGV